MVTGATPVKTGIQPVTRFSHFGVQMTEKRTGMTRESRNDNSHDALKAVFPWLKMQGIIMTDSSGAIMSDHQQKLLEIFDQINSLITKEKFRAASKMLLELHCADLADFLDNTSSKLYHIILPIISKKIVPETLVWLSNSNKEDVIEALGIGRAAILIDKLSIEDAIEVIEALSQELQEQLIASLKTKKRQQIIEGFTFPENTVGRILEKNFIAFDENWSIKQAIDYVRATEIPKDFHAAIVVNRKYQPVGSVLLSALLKGDPETSLSLIMNQDLKIADTYTEVDEIAFIFKQYALTIVPVVNKIGKLVGTISIDNMIYIIEEQTESEFMHLGGVNNSDIFDNLSETVKHRFPWLFINLIAACATSLVINQFSDTIQKVVTLATIMPIVASMGGNAGTQVMTVTIRALANREITQANCLKVILKEILACLLNGFSLAVIGSMVIYLLFIDYNLSALFIAAVVINFTIAGFIGSTIPIILDHFDIDPATASGVLLTALTDAFGFLSFLGLAFFFLV